MRHDVELRALLLAVIAGAAVQSLAAQNAEPPRAPRIIGIPAPTAPEAPAIADDAEAPVQSPVIVRRPPNAVRLAPLPEERSRDEPEEIIVIGQGWRLPDLGSEWRARQKEAASAGRFSATALPLYDPAAPPQHTAAFTSPEQRRHGYIELFRLRFGRRSRDDDEGD